MSRRGLLSAIVAHASTTPAFNPSTSLTNVLAIYDAEDQAGSNGSSVTAWTDHSGNGRDMGAITGTVTVVTGATPASGRVVRLASGTMTLPTDMGLISSPVIATASTVYSGTYAASKANDGDTTTSWVAGSGSVAPQRLRYQIKAGSTVVNNYTITADPNFPTRSPTAWTFEGSADASSWTTLDTRTGISFSGSTPQNFTSSNTTAYLYYRLNVSAGGGGAEIRLSEFILGGIGADVMNAGEMWFVIKSNTTSGAAWHLGRNAATNHYTFSGTIYDDFGTTTRQSYTPSVSVSSAYRIYKAAFTTDGVQYFELDGANQLTTAGLAQAWSYSPILFQSAWAGDVAWCMFRSGKSTITENAQIISYLNTKCGLTVAPPAAAPIGAFSFSEGSGSTTADSGSGGHTLTIDSLTTFVAGHDGYGLQSTATTTGQGAHAAWSGPTTGITVMAWVKPTALPAGQTQCICGFFDGSGNSEAVLWAQRGDFGTSNVLQLNIRFSGGLASITSTALTVGVWTHVALVYDGVNRKGYRNGTVFGSTAQTGSITASTLFTVAGPPISSTANGLIVDDVRVFSTGLTTAEVAYFMNAPIA